MKLNVNEEVTVVSATPYEAEGAMILCAIRERANIDPGDKLELEDGSLVTVVLYQHYVDKEKLIEITKANKVTEIPEVVNIFKKRGVKRNEVV